MENQLKISESFDLNIEKILENWEIYHGIREVIANAIDEKMLTQTENIRIEKLNEKTWLIKDFGRGIEYKNLTQNENNEKLSNNNIIGKFGIGLKDALATFNRKGVEVLIKSKHSDIWVKKEKKHGFENIKTLHAMIDPPTNSKMIGSEFILKGVEDEDIEIAKNQFLLFSDSSILDTTSFGEIIEKKSKIAFIYLNGIKVAEEENFLFSYNITSLDSKIRKSLNRERSNVGRAAYSDRIKLILKTTKNEYVIEALANDLAKLAEGENHDELLWIDVQEYAVKNLSAVKNVVFFTPEEVRLFPNFVDEANSADKKIIFITQALKQKIQNLVDINGDQIPEFDHFSKEVNDNFEYKFIEPSKLTLEEQEIFNQTNDILRLIGGKPGVVKEILISETLMKDETFQPAKGVWDSRNQRIIIERNQLKRLSEYSGTLLHEALHAKTGFSDITRDFELKLTSVMGMLVEKILKIH